MLPKIMCPPRLSIPTDFVLLPPDAPTEAALTGMINIGKRSIRGAASGTVNGNKKNELLSIYRQNILPLVEECGFCSGMRLPCQSFDNRLRIINWLFPRT